MSTLGIATCRKLVATKFSLWLPTINDKKFICMQWSLVRPVGQYFMKHCEKIYQWLFCMPCKILCENKNTKYRNLLYSLPISLDKCWYDMNIEWRVLNCLEIHFFKISKHQSFIAQSVRQLRILLWKWTDVIVLLLYLQHLQDGAKQVNVLQAQLNQHERVSTVMLVYFYTFML